MDTPKLTFLNKRPLTEVDDLKIEREGVPIGPPRVFSGTIDSRLDWVPSDCRQRIKTTLQNQNPAKEGEEVTLSTQFYGLPDKVMFASSLVDHLKRAEDFLYQQMPYLEHIRAAFTPITRRQDYSSEESAHGRGFIVQSLKELLTIHPTNKPTSSDLKFIGKGPHALLFWKHLTNPATSWYAVFSTNATGLNSYFSEMLGLHTWRGYAQHLRAVGPDEATIVAEAVTEAASHHLGIALMKKHYSPEIETLMKTTHLKDMADPAKPLYHLVPRTIGWIGRHGVLAALDLYNSNPVGFAHLIRAEPRPNLG